MTSDEYRWKAADKIQEAKTFRKAAKILLEHSDGCLGEAEQFFDLAAAAHKKELEDSK